MLQQSSLSAPLRLLLITLLAPAAFHAQQVPPVQHVSTAEELAAALEGGSSHVLVTEHIDLSSLELVGAQRGSGTGAAASVFEAPPGLQYLAVRCCSCYTAARNRSRLCTVLCSQPAVHNARTTV